MFWLNNMTSEGRMRLIKYILSSALLANLRFICFAQSDWRILTMKSHLTIVRRGVGVTEKEIKPINSGCILINLTVEATFFSVRASSARVSHALKIRKSV